VDSLLGPLVLWLTFRAIRRGTVSSYLWAGLASGLTLYAYLGSRLVVVVALGALAFQVVRQRGYLRGHVQHLLVFAAAAIFVAAPMAAFFIRHPDFLMARVNSESILHNGWLRQQVAAGRAVPEALLEQFAKSTLVYIAWGAPAGFFNSPQPYLTPLAAVFFVLGMGYTLLRLGQPFYLTLLIWFWAVVLLGSTLTVNAPTSERLVQSIPALAIFVALGLRKTAGVLQQLDLLPARWGMALSAVVIAITNVQGASFYFLTYRNGHYFEDAANELALEANLYASKLGSAYSFYLLGEPRVSVAFPIFSYLTPDVEKRNLTVVTRETLAALPRDRGAFFVAIPERQAELKQVARWAPGGQWWEMPRRNQPGVLYYAYLLSPEQFARPAADRLT